MFVPRALRLKGVKEHPRPKPSKPPPTARPEVRKDDALVDAMEGISTDSPASQPEHIDPGVVTRGPRFTIKQITPQYIAQLAVGIDLIFSDYAHQEEGRSKWLEQRYRTLDGEERFIHLTGILEHPSISTLKPEATQVLLQQALRDHPSEIVELSTNGYHVRRTPASYPPRFLPSNSFDVVDDDGLAFWDQRTIYVEPHLRNMCHTPAKVAHWLKEHGQLRSKWLPIQAVHMLWNSCAFVVLSSSVMHEDIWSKWRAAQKPANWKIMTKVDHTQRTAEYVALLEKENPRGMRGTMHKGTDPPAVERPAIARPAALPMNAEIVPEYTESAQEPKEKRKRNRRKDRFTQQSSIDDTNTIRSAAEAAGDGEPNNKRRG